MRSPGLFAILPLLFLFESATGRDDIEIQNWTAPPYWTPPASESPGVTPGVRGSRAALVTATPLPFVGINPCRQYDSRSASPLLQDTPRAVPLIGAPCGIPAAAQAAALNITIFNITGAASNGVFRVGTTSPPATAWINYPSTETQRGNAGVVGLTVAGEIVVQVNQVAGFVDFVVDVYGYYAPQGIVNSLNTLGGDVTLSAGTNVTITPSGQTLTIAAAGGGGGGTVTSVGTGAGLTGGPITLSGTVSVAPLGITTGMLADLAVTSAKLANGAVGLAQIDSSQVQARGTSTCPAGSTIQTINQDGSVVCTATSSVPGFSLTTLYSAGSVGQYTSVTIGSDGLGLISYYDVSHGDLKVAHCSNVACTTATLSTLDSTGVVGYYTSITIGSDGLGLISYYDATNGDLKVAHCLDAACTSATVSFLDTLGDVGQYTSITTGSDGLGLISYYDVSNGDLKVAHCSNVTCTAATGETLDSTGNTGQYTSITIGADGLGLISYFEFTNTDLWVAHCSDVTCASATRSRVVGGVASYGLFNSISIGSDSLGLISFFNGQTGRLNVAHCSDITCTSAAFSTLDFTANAGYFTAITIGPDGLGLISYYDLTNGDLRVAHCSNVSCTSAIVSTVDSTGDVGSFTSITIGSDGLGLISYYDATNGDLKVAHCSNALCTPYVRRR